MSNRSGVPFGETEAQNITPRMFPFDAWESDNPGRDGTPDLILKSSWRLRTESDLEIDGTLQIDGALFKSRTVVDSDDFTITDTDGVHFLDVTTGASDRTITWPTVADNPNRLLWIRKADTGAGKVINDGEGSETFDLYSGNELWQLTTFELLQAGDWALFWSDGSSWIKLNAPYWHKFDDPATGHKANITSWAAANDFSLGQEVTFTSAPIGSLAVRAWSLATSTAGAIYWRKSGDAGISNTPDTSQEFSHRIHRFNGGSTNDLYMSSERKVQFTPSDTGTDLAIAPPLKYLQ